MKKRSEETFPELLTIQEVAEMLGVDDTTVRRWCRTGALDYVSLPRIAKREAYRVRLDTITQGLATGTFARAPERMQQRGYVRGVR